MIIYDKKGNILLDIKVDDESFRYRSIRKDNTVTLYFSLIEHIELPVGSYITYQRERYTLWLPSNFTKDGTRAYAYTVVFGGAWEFLKLVKYKNLSVKPAELKFTLWADPNMFLRMLIDCLNEADPAKDWRLGDYLEAIRKNISFNHEYCYDVLQRLADEFNTEFEFEGKTLHFRKVEKFKDEPLHLSYGKGNGFLPGTGRAGNGKTPVTRLYVQGGDRNIDHSKYGSRTLLLPKNQTLEYEGRLYKTDTDGTYIERADKTPSMYSEGSYDGSEIYPRRVGTVTGTITINPEQHLYQFKDSTIPEDLNFEDCIIEGETMTVIFQSGALVGREFEVKYHHSDRLFEIVPATLDGFELPNESLKPSIGGDGTEPDTYAVFNIALPDAYICNNTDKSGASWDMLREAVRYFYDNEDEQFSFTGELDGLWSKKKWHEIGGRIIPGGYIMFSDEQFQPKGILIRITGVKDYINDPHSPQIELSNVAVSGSVSSELGKLEAEEVVNKEFYKDALSFTKRRFRDAKETMELLENAQLNFSESINPVAVQTMQLIVGDESLQFRYVNGRINPIEVDHTMRYNDESRMFYAGNNMTALIQHMTLGINIMSPDHTPSPDKKYKFWDITPITELIPDSAARYIYLKCNKTNEADGKYVLSKTSIKMEEVAGYYHFLAAILNSEYEGVRSFVPMYGFTEITPGQMRVNKIISSDGTQYWDMLSKRFKIGNDNSFLSWNEERFPNQLRLKGTIVQSESGDTDYLEIDRGSWAYGIRYYPGDKVKYAGNGNIYKCILSHINIEPPDTTYWKELVTKGEDGKKGEAGKEGQGYMYAYKGSNLIGDVPQRPTSAGGYLPSGWDATPNMQGFKYMYQTQCVKSNGVWGSWSQPVLFNYTPDKGDPGPGIVFRGVWEDITPARFYNNAARRDVIMTGWDKVYYLFKGDDGELLGRGESWAWNSKWEQFGAQFSSVATDLLLAINANVGGWIFKNNQLQSQAGGAYLDGRDGTVNITGKFTSNKSGNKIVIDPDELDKGLKFYDEKGRLVGRLYFTQISTYSGAIMELHSYVGNTYSGKTIVSAGQISLYSGSDSNNPDFRMITSNGGLTFYINPDKLPTSDSWQTTSKGDIWRDGNTLKIKTS